MYLVCSEYSCRFSYYLAGLAAAPASQGVGVEVGVGVVVGVGVGAGVEVEVEVKLGVEFPNLAQVGSRRFVPKSLNALADPRARDHHSLFILSFTFNS